MSELAFFGLSPEDYGDENTVFVWPDNVAAVNVMVAMGTQWRVGPVGAYGLDYGVLPQVMDLTGIAPADRADVFDAIRTMEDSALEEMRKT